MLVWVACCSRGKVVHARNRRCVLLTFCSGCVLAAREREVPSATCEICADACASVPCSICVHCLCVSCAVQWVARARSTPSGPQGSCPFCKTGDLRIPDDQAAEVQRLSILAAADREVDREADVRLMRERFARRRAERLERERLRAEQEVEQRRAAVEQSIHDLLAPCASAVRLLTHGPSRAVRAMTTGMLRFVPGAQKRLAGIVVDGV